MNRFSQLEFDEQHPKQNAGAAEPPRDAAFYFQRGREFWLAADYENALRQFSRAIECQSSFFPGWLGQVEMLIELEEYPEAVLWADKALQYFPEHPELLAGKALALARNAQVEPAQKLIDNALSKDRVTSFVWLVRADVLLTRKSDRAEPCLHTAVGLADKDTAICKLKAGRVLLRHRQCSKALPYLTEAVQQLPQALLAWYDYARCQEHLGFRDTAARAYEEALKLRPHWQPAQEGLNHVSKRRLFAWLRRR